REFRRIVAREHFLLLAYVTGRREGAAGERLDDHVARQPRSLTEREHARERDEVMRPDAVQDDLQRLPLSDRARAQDSLAEYIQYGLRLREVLFRVGADERDELAPLRRTDAPAH